MMQAWSDYLDQLKAGAKISLSIKQLVECKIIVIKLELGRFSLCGNLPNQRRLKEASGKDENN